MHWQLHPSHVDSHQMPEAKNHRGHISNRRWTATIGLHYECFYGKINIWFRYSTEFFFFFFVSVYFHFECVNVHEIVCDSRTNVIIYEIIHWNSCDKSAFSQSICYRNRIEMWEYCFGLFIKRVQKYIIIIINITKIRNEHSIESDNHVSTP